MKNISHLLKNNKQWAKELTHSNPNFFTDLVHQQSPEYLWIGCSDSRVPANEIVGLLPGELFVHRNVANLVIHTDMNCLSVLQYAIDVLKIKHIVVCGHYGCGGVKAAIDGNQHGLIDNWLRTIKEIYQYNKKEFLKIKDENTRIDKLCELNVKTQVLNVANTTVVQDAWIRGHGLTIHGWIYDIKDGLLKDLDCSIQSKKEFYRIIKNKNI